MPYSYFVNCKRRKEERPVECGQTVFDGVWNWSIHYRVSFCGEQIMHKTANINHFVGHEVLCKTANIDYYHLVGSITVYAILGRTAHA
jgi:hypothetical protein